MAKPTNPDTLIQLLPLHILSKVGASMDFSWNKVVKGEFNAAMAKCTERWFIGFFSHSLPYAESSELAHRPGKIGN